MSRLQPTGRGGEAVKVVFCTPTITRPHQAYLDALEAEIPHLEGLDHYAVYEVGCPYISAARATLLRKALDVQPDAVVFLDHDVSWRPGDLRKLIDTPGDVVAGTYRYKCEEERYMGALIEGADLRAQGRADGCLLAHTVPAGFLKVTPGAVHRFMKRFPELTCGPKYRLSVDLFNHGVIDGCWYGEDVAFCKRWREIGGQIWLVPDLNIGHHSATEAFPGNFHGYMLRASGEVPQQRRNDLWAQPTMTVRQVEDTQAQIWKAAE